MSKKLGLYRVLTDLPATTEQTDVNAILQQTQSADLSQDAAFDQRVAEARGELATLEREAAKLETEAAAAGKTFETDPSPETHQAMVVTAQLAKNASARMVARQNEHAPLLSAAGLRERQQRLEGLRKQAAEWRARFDARRDVLIALIEAFEEKVADALSEQLHDMRQLNALHRDLDALEMSLGTGNRYSPVSAGSVMTDLGASLDRKFGSSNYAGPSAQIQIDASSPNQVPLLIVALKFRAKEVL